jgi:transcriptional regulator PpsR
LERWLGRPGVDMPVLIANLKEHGAVRGFATVLRGTYGGSEEVDVTAVAALDAETPCLGFVLRRLARRSTTPARNGEANGLPRTADQLTELIGRMPLKEIVTETTDAIERMCIETALKLTRDNRASAAQMLGLSRQSLYAKLKRYDIGGPDDDDES